MSKSKKTEEKETDIGTTETKKVGINDLEWNDFVLGLLANDEKIDGNPTTDGLRRIFEIALNCTVVESVSQVVQSPDPNNEKRATVVHSIGYILNGDTSTGANLNTKRVVSGAADVYWGNCDKIYRNHPVAVAETRAEGRALRRGLKLRKVVAAEEISKEIEDNPDQDTVSKISPNQINFIDILAKRLNINVGAIIVDLGLDPTNIYNMSHENAVNVLRELSRHQQDLGAIPPKLLGYEPSWR
jgi:hypothetical protein